MGRKYLLHFIVIISFTTCYFNILSAQSFDNPKPFPTKGRKQVSILKKVYVNADTLKMLLVVPNSNIFVSLAKDMKYFNEVMTIADLQKNIIAKGLSNKIPSISDRIGLYNAYIYYRPFVMLSQSVNNLGRNGYRVKLNLYDPMRSDLIFQNEVRLNISWEEYSDVKVLFPLLNSLVDYLNER